MGKILVHRFFLAGLLFAGAVLLAFMFSPQIALPFACVNCNVVLVSIDTLGAKHLGLYGSSVPTSPFLDRIAREQGIIFENAFVQAPWTLPSHGAMFTGRYPGELGLWLPTDALPPDAVTLAEALKARGYITQAFSHGAFVQPEWGFDQGFDGFQGVLARDQWDDAEVIFPEAAGWLAGRDKGKPFFLFVRSFHVHDPYTPSDEALEAIGVDPNDIAEVHIEDIVDENTKAYGPAGEEAEKFRNAHDAEVRELDSALEDFFAVLVRERLLDKTIVILTADHGEEFGEHGTAGFHVALYNETIHVPLIAFVPRAPADRIASVVEIRAIPSTIFSLLDPSAENPFPTLPFLPRLVPDDEDAIALTFSGLGRKSAFALDEEGISAIEKSYATLPQIGTTIVPKPCAGEWTKPYYVSARSRKWHVIKNPDQGIELYDFVADPGEQQNLFPTWETLSVERRREALVLLEALDAAVAP